MSCLLCVGHVPKASTVLSSCHWLWAKSGPHSCQNLANLSCWSFLQSRGFLNSQIQLRVTGTYSRDQIHSKLSWYPKISKQITLCKSQNKTKIKIKITFARWNITIRPPLSPHASSLPSELNSTQEIKSANKKNLVRECNNFKNVPSVKSSSSVPFTWEKAHCISLFSRK